MDLFPYEPARNLLPQPLARLTWKLRPMCESAIMADTTMDIHIGTQVITAIAEGSTATGIIATAVGIIIEEVTTPLPRS